jgi:hypothetical protein
MCGNYGPVNKQTQFDKDVMSLPKEIFYSISQAKVFNALDLYGLNIIGIAFPRRRQSEDYILGH